MFNLFADIPAGAAGEIFNEVLLREDVRIDRIVSTGQSTPAVLLLAGSAGLRIDGESELNLRTGDHVLIAAHRAHWVTWTAKDQPKVWLAVHFS